MIEEWTLAVLRRRLERRRELAALATSRDMLAAYENDIAALEELLGLVERRRRVGSESGNTDPEVRNH
jgi:hypothetical protein